MTLNDILQGPEILVALSWWSERLDGADFDAGDARLNPEGAAALGGLHRPKAEGQTAFYTALRNLLATAIKPAEWTDPGLILTCDTHPEGILAEACAAAGIRLGLGVLPTRTRMIVREGKVMVASGLGAEWKTIFSVGALPS